MFLYIVDKKISSDGLNEAQYGLSGVFLPDINNYLN